MTILEDVKKILDIQEDDKSFDLDVLTHIDSAVFVLEQAGVKVLDSVGETSTWEDVFGPKPYGGIKQYVYAAVKQIFDPFPNSFTNNMLDDKLKELVWRLSVASDSTSA